MRAEIEAIAASLRVHELARLLELAVISSRPIALRCSWIERSMSKRSSDSRGRPRSSAFNSCHSRSATVSSRFAMFDVSISVAQVATPV